MHPGRHLIRWFGVNRAVHFIMLINASAGIIRCEESYHLLKVLRAERHRSQTDMVLIVEREFPGTDLAALIAQP